MSDKKLKKKIIKMDPEFEKRRQKRDRLEYMRQTPKHKKFDYTQIKKEKK